MEALTVRFEQQRGHFMVIGREPPLSREELNEMQLRMLKQCEIPGLLPLETEECDGQVRLRYNLTGTRMLSEALRGSRWTMSEMMAALCKLAEVLEGCRLYLLDAEKIRLRDEFIFVGDDWHDLVFTYLPFRLEADRGDDLERLIVRWTMRVKEPDGRALQRVLAIVSDAGFVPAALSRYAKQYLAESLRGEMGEPPRFAEPAAVEAEERLADDPNPPKASRAWDLLQPVSGDPQPVSELLGDARAPRLAGVDPSEETDSGMRSGQAPVIDPGRWRLIVACASALALAIAWKYVYLDRPDSLRLIVSLCLTLLVAAIALTIWNGAPKRWSMKQPAAIDDPDIPEIERTFRAARSDSGRDSARWEPPRLRDDDEPLSSLGPEMPHRASSAGEEQTSWLARDDRTALLDRHSAAKADACCLVWDAPNGSRRIPLRVDSFVIGRSADAAQHVDDSVGVSRAHVEIARMSDGWKAKDLGSRNGTLLNDKPMAPYEWYTLRPGDRLKLAESHYRFQPAED
ncbi:DUF6382 domain-containing protein [Paenibacillaceae bacterium WGS1546]|uniref:DUF6382 domain-containing protein n=1 Tax=Cohnella sp. WGS1546 TaxID=3366810 RepID=UPI00372CEE4C